MSEDYQNNEVLDVSSFNDEINVFWETILSKCNYKFYRINPHKQSDNIAKLMKEDFVEKHDINGKISVTFNLEKLEFEYIMTVNNYIDVFVTRAYYFEDGFGYRLTFDKNRKVFLGYETLDNIEKYLLRIQIIDNKVYLYQGDHTKATR